MYFSLKNMKEFLISLLMKNLKLAAAQSASIKGDLHKNIINHLRFAEAAKLYNADFILFPELSLTGYEPDLAENLALYPDDRKLKPLADFASANRIIIAAGAPLKGSDNRINIGLLCFMPDGEIKIHTKEYLHPGEEKYFAPGTIKCAIDLNNEIIALAVCADTSHPEHSEEAAGKGASIYAVSALCSEKGYIGDTEFLNEYSGKYGFLVLLSNHSMKTGGWVPCGRSGFWHKGKLLKSMPGNAQGIVIAEKISEHWTCEIIYL